MTYDKILDRANNWMADQNHLLEASGEPIRFVTHARYVRLSSGDHALVALLVEPESKQGRPAPPPTANNHGMVCGEPDCQSLNLRPNGSCMICLDCGSTTGCG